MKWIGQHIYDLISRFRNDIYLEDVSTGAIASGGNLGLDSNNKIVKATVSGGGTPTDITVANEGTDTTCFPLFVTAVTGDLGPKTQSNLSFNANTSTLSCTGFTGNFVGDLTGDVTGEADTATTLATARAINGVDFNGSAPITITAAAGTLSGTELKSTVVTSSLTSVGTIGTGVWQGTAIATAYIADDAVTEDKLANTLLAEIDANTAKSTNRAYFEFKGYGSSDGTNYEMPEIISDNNAPFEHNTSTGSDGLTAQAVTVVMRQGGVVMPYTGTLKKFTGWVTTQGTGTVDVGIFKFTPVDNNASTVTPVLLVNEQITGAGNTKMRYFSETSSFDAGFTAGDVLYPAVLGSGSGKSWYLNSMLEVEWS